jgi:hypothetical protein
VYKGWKNAPLLFDENIFFSPCMNKQSVCKASPWNNNVDGSYKPHTVYVGREGKRDKFVKSGLYQKPVFSNYFYDLAKIINLIVLQGNACPNIFCALAVSSKI